MQAKLEQLLRELVTISGINCVIQGEQAVAELFFSRPNQAQLSFLDGWGTLETPEFHIHFKSIDLAGARFIEEAGSCMEAATYLKILDRQGQERLRFYFANDSDTSRHYTPEELSYFDHFRSEYGDLW